MIALVPRHGTKNPIFGVLAHGLQVFLLLQTTLIRGVRGFIAFKRNDIINELNV